MLIIDLTHTMHAKMPVFPGTPQPSFQPIHTISEHGFSQLDIHTYTHMGTHIDAPFHMVANGKTLDELPIDQFVGSASILDLKYLGKKQIDVADLLPHENKIRAVDFVIFDLGWSTKWGQAAFFEEFPCLSLEAARWLIQFDLKGVGMDTCSVDPIDAEVYRIHHTILGKGMIIIENLSGLEEVEAEVFQFQCFPLKIEKADGCPVRALAFC
jgi:arylformamidase